MSNTIKEVTRRCFLKVAGVATVMTVTGIHFVDTAKAAALDFIGKRQTSVYNADANIYAVRKSQDNPMVQKIYAKDGFLHDGPCGHKSHDLLHTHYTDRSAELKKVRAKGIKLKL
ncbi:MAG: hydrogenase small subunit [Deltaproteobacteria bacterium]|nr:hydrogenase small subunit [Deltaproteobacteria bacterium]